MELLLFRSFPPVRYGLIMYLIIVSISLCSIAYYLLYLSHVSFTLQLTKKFRKNIPDYDDVSCWVLRGINSFEHRPILTTKSKIISISTIKQQDNQSFNSSPYIILDGNSDSTGNLRRSVSAQIFSGQNNTTVKTVAVYDPQNIFKTFLRANTFDECEYKNCKPIKNVEHADAVIFIMPKLKTAPTFKRKRNQVWIFHTIEAPSRSNWFGMLSIPTYKHGMNLTATFNLKSDIPNLYGHLTPVKDPPPTKNYDAIFRNKSKMAAWFVSHCKTRSDRMKYVNKMKSRLDVDVFGLCGTKFCRNPERSAWGRHEREMIDESTCFPMLSSQYKFYLAFENTMCRQYITEKFFKLLKDVDVIPVVRGGADYQNYFPADMFVDSSDFSSPESLADFLSDLAGDKERYIQYLKNKDRFTIWRREISLKCRICEKLHTMGGHVTYDNVHDWWTSDACFDPRDSKLTW